MTKEEAIEKLKVARERLDEAHGILKDVFYAVPFERSYVITAAKAAFGRVSSAKTWVEDCIKWGEEEMK